VATSGSGPLAFEAPSQGPVHFSGHLDRGAILASGDGLVRMELSLRADATPGMASVHVPTDLVVVLDRSGSMSGDKLAHARGAIRALLDRLGPEDRFALVTYSDAAELQLPLSAATPAARAAWLASVEGISAGGGTNMAAGLDLGLGTVDAARSARDRARAPRVILISDGLANQGDVSRDGLRGRAARAASGEYALSTVGVGLDFDEELMASLADAGTGNFHYLENAVNLSEIFASELATARETVARGVTLHFAPAPGVEWVEAAGYPIERAADGSLQVQPGSLFAGQDRRVWATLRVARTGPATQALGSFSLSYRNGDTLSRLAFSETPRIARVSQDADFYAQIDRDRWSQAVVVDEYNRLQREVAQDLKQGKADEARAKISLYDRSVGTMNAQIRSPEVAKQLREAKDLAVKLEAAAAAPEPERARTVKELQAGAVTGARPGSMK
jgi:Ca-activated chloride channel family protein